MTAMIDILPNPSRSAAAPAQIERSPLRALSPIAPAEFHSLRRRLMLHHCKWDSQVQDVCALADFPLVMSRNTWLELRELAEKLTAESMEAEGELLHRPNLWAALSIPWRVRRAMKDVLSSPTPPAPRIMRFDFHWTTDGWQISEVNSDVPGGYTESTSFTSMMLQHYPRHTAAGCATTAWTSAIAQSTSAGSIALLSAPGLIEDLQVVSYLAQALNDHGCKTCLTDPKSIAWGADGHAFLKAAAGNIPLDMIVRFYQAEWLPGLRRRCPWRYFFTGSRTPITNPGTSILLESKRFPLLWDQLVTRLPTWRQLLPESRDPRRVRWTTDENWILKSAHSNNGDSVLHAAWPDRAALQKARWDIRFFPNHWIAQRRFSIVPIATPAGAMYPCIGIYTVDGRGVGIYARISPKPIIDYSAIDVAVLIEPATPTSKVID
jgi:glutathionylspermidine synthase